MGQGWGYPPDSHQRRERARRIQRPGKRNPATIALAQNDWRPHVELGNGTADQSGLFGQARAGVVGPAAVAQAGAVNDHDAVAIAQRRGEPETHIADMAAGAVDQDQVRGRGVRRPSGRLAQVQNMDLFACDLQKLALRWVVCHRHRLAHRRPPQCDARTQCEDK